MLSGPYGGCCLADGLLGFYSVLNREFFVATRIAVHSDRFDGRQAVKSSPQFHFTVSALGRQLYLRGTAASKH